MDSWQLSPYNGHYGTDSTLSFYSMSDLMQEPVLIIERSPLLRKEENSAFHIKKRAKVDSGFVPSFDSGSNLTLLYMNKSLRKQFEIPSDVVGSSWCCCQVETEDAQNDEPPLPFLSSFILKKQFSFIVEESLQHQTTKEQYLLCKSKSDPESQTVPWKVTIHPFQNRVVCIFTAFKDELPPGASDNLTFLKLACSAKGKTERTPELEPHPSKRRSSLENLAEPMSLLSETIPQLVWTTRADGYVDYMNKQWATFTGRSVENLLGWSWIDIVHPEDIPRTTGNWVTALKTGGKYEVEYRFRRYDGVYRWFLGRGLPLRDEDGTIVKWFGTSTDIDDRKRAERERSEAIEALKISELHFRQLFESNIIGIVFTNSAGKIVDVNDAFLSIVGYQRDEILQGRIGWKDINQSRTPEMSQPTTKNQVMKFEQEYVTKNGSVIFVLVGCARMESDMITFVMDITERKNAENRALEAARAKSFFIANISHEIRTPMSGIIGMTDMILDTPLTEQQNEYATTIKRSADDLLHLINDILDFSKFEAGKVDLQEVEFNILSVIDEVVSLLGESANLKNIDLHYYGSDILRVKNVLGDPGRFRQVLINLVGNSIKFTEKGEICVGATANMVNDNEIEININVRDTGIGILEDKRKHLFKPFSQIDNTSTRKYSGTGLGLAICKQLVDAMGGDLRLISTVGVGSEFFFTIRVKLRGDSDAPVNPFGNRKPTILVVCNCRMFCKCLEESGSRVVEALSAEQALELLATYGYSYFDVAICAVQCLGDIHNYLKVNKSLTKLIVTGHPSVLKDITHEVDAVLPRPNRQLRLLETVSRVLSLQSSPSTLHTHQTQQAIENKASPDHNQHCILLAEDNPVNQMVAVRQLGKLGYRSVVAENGQQVIEQLERSSFSLILMDVQMPVLDGISCTKIIREREKVIGVTPTPIIAMTANAMSASIEECFSSGMTDYISKPVKIEVLKDTLLKWIPQP